MPTANPEDVHDEIQRMREALRMVVRGSLLSQAQVEQALDMCEGYLTVIFAGKVELRVAHVFGILRVLGMPPWLFFLGMDAMAERQSGEHHAA